LKIAIEIVDLPSYKMVDLSIAMSVYWRVNGGFSSKACLMTPKDIGYV